MIEGNALPLPYPLRIGKEMLYEYDSIWLGADRHHPGQKISLSGQFAERISEYVETPLTVTALAMECGNEQLVLVSADWVGLPTQTLELVRARLSRLSSSSWPTAWRAVSPRKKRNAATTALLWAAVRWATWERPVGGIHAGTHPIHVLNRTAAQK